MEDLLLTRIEEATGHKTAFAFYVFLRATGKHQNEFISITRKASRKKVFNKWIDIPARAFTFDLSEVRMMALEELLSRLPTTEDLNKIYRCIQGLHHRELEAKEILEKIPTI